MNTIYIYVVMVTLTSARCDTVLHTPMTTMIFRQVQRTVGLCFYEFRCRSDLLLLLLWSPSITDDDDFLFNVGDTT